MRVRTGALWVMAAMTLVAACDAPTALRVTVTWDTLEVDQLAIAVLDGEAPVVQDAIVAPLVPRPLDGAGESLLVILPDEVAGRELTVSVDGFAGDRTVGSGEVAAVSVLAQTVDLTLQLGPSRCGDGERRPVLEACDDGNATAGDGCDARCRREPSVSATDGGESLDGGEPAQTGVPFGDELFAYPGDTVVVDAPCAGGDGGVLDASVAQLVDPPGAPEDVDVDVALDNGALVVTVGEGARAPRTFGLRCGADAPASEVTLHIYAEACHYLLVDGVVSDGAYWLDPDGALGPSPAARGWCDMTTEGGGWTQAAAIAGDDATWAYDGAGLYGRGHLR
jgi:cysteine-rich repeat protein